MIGQLSTKYHFNEEGKIAMESIRLIGNKAVHDGRRIERTDTTNPDVLFWLVKYIVEQIISKHKEAKEMNSLAIRGVKEANRPWQIKKFLQCH